MKYASLYNKNYKTRGKKRVSEGSVTHSESISQLATQIKKFILKHRETPNTIVNDICIGLFLGFSEAFAQDNDISTNGLNMLTKLIDKLKVLMKEYDDLVPNDDEDFDLEAGDIQDMETTLDSDVEKSDEGESENGEEEEQEEDLSQDVA
jgi:hypothetical protein